MRLRDVEAALIAVLHRLNIPLVVEDGVSLWRITNRLASYRIWSCPFRGYYLSSDVDATEMALVTTEQDFRTLASRVVSDLRPWWLVEAMGHGRVPR